MYLALAILLNAVGTAFMSKSNLGMTVWGGTSYATSLYFGVSLGVGFVILAVVFYAIAVLLDKKIDLVNAAISFINLLLFGLLSDFFIWLFPSAWFDTLPIVWNLVGLAILNLGIAVHLRINLFVFPLDYYLGVMQRTLKSVAKGTYVAYFSAFIVYLLLGYLNQGYFGFGYGTIFTLTLSGANMALYDLYVTDRLVKL